VEIEISKGEFVAVMGLSGCGVPLPADSHCSLMGFQEQGIDYSFLTI